MCRPHALVRAGGIIGTGAAVKSPADRYTFLMVTSAERSPALSEVPTVPESGIPGYEFAAWYLLLAPAKTPAGILEKVNSDLRRITSQPDCRKRIEEFGGERDLIGYGNRLPDVRWPGAATVAVSFLLDFEEGAEFSISNGDPRNESIYEVIDRQDGPDPSIDSHFEYATRTAW